jgi:hypothetical protein
MRARVKAVLLLYPGLVGALTGLAVTVPFGSGSEAIGAVAFLGLLYLGLASVLVIMWRRPPQEFYLGHSREIWLLLISLSYALGLILMFVPLPLGRLR